jgi:ACT domain-containing protein
MCLFCDCEDSRKWRQIVDKKLDAIAAGIASILTPEQRTAIEKATADLKIQTDALNQAVLTNKPKT